MIYHNYIFLKSRVSLTNLSKKEREKYEKEFLKILQSDKNVITYTFSMVGLKANMNILIWFQADSIESIQNLLNELMHSDLGKHLKIKHTLLGMTRQTQYSYESTGHLDTTRQGGKYLIIYPFTKTKQWHMLDFETRKKLMWGHVSIGKKHSDKITQLLLYSYGIDDSEFIVSYEANELSDFQTLVMELRTDKVREYTLKDTPIFACIYKSPEEALKFL